MPSPWGAQRSARKHAASAADIDEPSTSRGMSLAFHTLGVFTPLAAVAVGHLLHSSSRLHQQDCIRCAVAIVTFMAASWGFVVLTMESDRRRDMRKIMESRRYKGVLKRFSEKNGWGLLSVPGHRDARIYRAERDLLSLELGEAVDFRIEADWQSPGWFKAIDCIKIDVSEVQPPPWAELEQERRDRPKKDEQFRRKRPIPERRSEALAKVIVRDDASKAPSDKDAADVTEATCSGDSDAPSSDAAKETSQAGSDVRIDKFAASEITSEEMLSCLSMST